MLTRFEADFRAGGYPNPTYTGTKTFSMLTYDKSDQMLYEAEQRARRIIASEGCWSIRSVTITDLRVL